MINMKRCFSNSRLMKALPGVTIQEFEKLLGAFTKELSGAPSSNRKERKRKAGGGRHHTLSTPAEKLGFGLF